MIRLLIGFWFACSLAWALSPLQVVVLCNEASLLSQEAASTYARERGIPSSQVVRISGLPVGKDISRSDFERLIVQPLLYQASVHDWKFACGVPRSGHAVIYALVLMPDLPLRVRAEQGEPGGMQKTTGASLDSELAMIGISYPKAGPMGNPYFRKDVEIEQAKLPVTIVCRIDGPDRAAILRMIQDPIAVEKYGLSGWTVVDQGGPYPQGDAWFAAVAKRATDAYQPLFRDTERATLPPHYPLMEDTAYYFGWYTQVPDGPFGVGAGGGFRFAPGAVAYHLHSFSATSVKDPKCWVGALLSRGASVTAGNVAEPFLDGTLEPSIFYDRLLKGYTVGEAAMMAMPCLSWQWVVLGDPLYRPRARHRKERFNLSACELWEELCRQANGSPIRLQKLIPQRQKPSQEAEMAEMYGSLCQELNNPELAVRFFAYAAGRYGRVRDQLRCLHRQAVALRAAGKTAEEAQLRELCTARAASTPYAKAFPAAPPAASPSAAGQAPAPKVENQGDAPGRQ